MLDIIIPCFNAKKTLGKTLESIKNQKYFKDFKVYLVNDKSDYNYLEFINKYKNYFYIKELTHSKNMGPGIARNTGINNSNSKYIMFIDSDDYLISNIALKILVDTIDNGFDMVVSSFMYERDNIKIIKENNNVWLHGKIFRREFIENNNIRFNNTRANEDNGFIRLILFLYPKRYDIKYLTYLYYDNPKSITRKNNRYYRFQGLDGFTYNMKWAIEEANNKNSDKKSIAATIQSIYVTMYYYYLELYNQYDNNKLIEWTKRFNDLYKEYEKYMNDSYTNIFLSQKESEYLQEKKEINKFISYEDFIKLVK